MSNDQTSIDIPPCLEGEKWKDIPGYEGRYCVSNLGRAYSYRKKNGCNRIVPGKILRPPISATGYPKISVYSNAGKLAVVQLHRPIAKLFVPGYAAGLVVNHIDGNKRNNHHANLEWCTPRQNAVHASQRGLLATVDWGHSKINEEIAAIMREMRHDGMHAKDIAAFWGLSHRHAVSVLNGKVWAAA